MHLLKWVCVPNPPSLTSFISWKTIFSTDVFFYYSLKIFKVIMSISSFVQCLACPALFVIFKADSTAQSELAGDWPYTEVMLENHNFLFGRTFIKVCVFFLKLFSSSEKHFKDFYLSLFCWKFYSSCSFLALTIP